MTGIPARRALAIVALTSARIGCAIGANSFCISMTIIANFDEFKSPGIVRDRDRDENKNEVCIIL